MKYVEAKEKIVNYLKARIPFISIDTLEKDRALRIFKELSSEINSNIYVYSMSRGIYNLSDDSSISSEKTMVGALSFINEDIKNKRNAIYILADVAELENESVSSRYLCDLTDDALASSVSIVVLTEKSIWPNLRRLGLSLELDYPDKDEIYEIVNNLLSKYRNEINIEWDQNDIKEASIILQGLSESEIKNVMSVLIAKRVVAKTDLNELKFVKDKMFSNIDGLEKIEVGDISSAGLTNLKAWLNSKKKLFEVDNKELLEKRGIKTPRGILIVGVPGCGKSLTAKMISKEWNLPLYLLDFATVQGKYVGQSEEQLKAALKMAEHVSPCVLWIDEIEKGLAGMDDSSGVTGKMIGQFLFWLQECKKEVFVVATANNVSALPAELLRKGRFDELFFVDLPNNEERMQIISLYFEKYLRIKADMNMLQELSAITDGFASSDIESTIRDISYHLIAEKTELTKDFIVKFFKDSTSISKTNPEKINYIKNWCNGRAKNAS